MRFSSLRQLADLCGEARMTIGRFMLAEQAVETGVSEQEAFRQMQEYYLVMKEAVRRGIEEPVSSRSGLTGGDAPRVHAYRQNGDPALGAGPSLAMAYALAVSEVNASMGRIVATPTAGSCGIIPGVFVSSQERWGWDDERMVFGLFCAGAIGYVIANQSFISGAEGGCQAEVGSAIGMAAGALTELRGGAPEQALHAVGLAVKNSLGLICDPVGGLVEIPCIVRNGFGSVTALAASDMALAGVRSVIPSDEVIGVMREVGAAMPAKHRETAKGGLAQTPTGRKLMQDWLASEARKEMRVRSRKKEPGMTGSAEWQTARDGRQAESAMKEQRSEAAEEEQRSKVTGEKRRSKVTEEGRQSETAEEEQRSKVTGENRRSKVTEEERKIEAAREERHSKVTGEKQQPKQTSDEPSASGSTRHGSTDRMNMEEGGE